MAAICRRALELRRVAGAVAGVSILIPQRTSEWTMRAVDAAGVAVAFTVALTSNPPQVFHFAAGEAYTAADLRLLEPLDLTVASAAGSTVELLIWEG
jgi:hypothetical protein